MEEPEQEEEEEEAHNAMSSAAHQTCSTCGCVGHFSWRCSRNEESDLSRQSSLASEMVVIDDDNLAPQKPSPAVHSPPGSRLMTDFWLKGKEKLMGKKGHSITSWTACVGTNVPKSWAKPKPKTKSKSSTLTSLHGSSASGSDAGTATTTTAGLATGSTASATMSSSGGSSKVNPLK